ncbi:MAG: hypothetical protein Q8J69_08385 [Sphingobacteriaceae bacterium]|nr:hypothetical protein [Sphingobacteriaceae bacterium]
MRNRLLFLCLWPLLAVLQQSCDTRIKGELLPNQPPKTFTVVDTIIRNGNDRFTSTVLLNWWGTDPDGFVVGYEFTFDPNPGPATVWIATNKTDSTFLLTVPSGQDTFDFRFTVRAIDNEGLKDPNPASVRYPVKNSPPDVDFVYAPAGGNPLAGGFPLVSYPVLRYEWLGTDPDGLQTLESYELVFNDTLNGPGIFTLSATFNEVILKAENLNGVGSACLVYPGQNENPLATRMQGLVFEDSNYVYIRAVDQSGARSAWQQSRPTYVKRPTSSFLLINAYSSDPNPDLNAANIQALYQTEFSNIGITNYDQIRIFQRQGNQFINLSPNNRTQSLVFDLFDQILWVGPDFDISIVFAQNTLGRFLNGGGKVMLSLASSLGSAVVSNFYEFSPIDSLQAAPPGFEFLLGDTSSLSPVAANYPTLRYRGFTSSVRPIKFVGGVQPLYRANILLRGGSNPFPPFPLFNGNNVIMGMRTNTSNNSKFIITTLELHRLNNNNNLGVLLDRILKTEFGVQ